MKKKLLGDWFLLDELDFSMWILKPMNQSCLRPAVLVDILAESLETKVTWLAERKKVIQMTQWLQKCSRYVEHFVDVVEFVVSLSFDPTVNVYLQQTCLVVDLMASVVIEGQNYCC